MNEPGIDPAAAEAGTLEYSPHDRGEADGAPGPTRSLRERRSVTTTLRFKNRRLPTLLRKCLHRARSSPGLLNIYMC